jgi:hypothetical protein
MSAKLDEHHIYGSARLGVDNRDMLLHRTTITLGYNPWTEGWSLAPQYIYQMPPLDPQHPPHRANTPPYGHPSREGIYTAPTFAFILVLYSIQKHS